MTYCIGLDISMKTTSLCVVNSLTTDIVKQVELPTQGDVISAFVQGAGFEDCIIGMETGALSRALSKELRNLGHDEVHVFDARKMSAIIKTGSHKSDKNDALTIATVVRLNWFSPIHHKSDTAVEIKIALKIRAQLVDQRTQIKNTIRGLLKFNGIKIGLGLTTIPGFLKAVSGAIEECSPEVKDSFEVSLKTLESLQNSVAQMDAVVERLRKKHRDVVDILTSTPGIGPITALSFIAEIDDPTRFNDGGGKSVGAFLGLVPRLNQSGDVSRHGGISKFGPTYLRSLLYEAALVMMTRTKTYSSLKGWAGQLNKRAPIKVAATALARKLGILLWRMWVDMKPFEYTCPTKKKKRKQKKPPSLPLPLHSQPLLVSQAFPSASCARS